jgi:hypothetical protein
MQDEKDGWIYWLGFFASHGRLQLHGSDGNTMAADCCNRFQKRCWEMGGTLTRDNAMTQNYDRVNLVIGDTGAYDIAITRTRTTAQGVSVSYSVIGVFAEKGKLVLTDGKLSAKGAKGGQATLQLYVEPGSSERMLKVDAKDSEGFTYSAELKRTGDFASAK